MKNRLSVREIEILDLISHGLSSKEIASLLFLSQETIRTHRKNLIYKFKAKNSVNLIRIAMEEKIIGTSLFEKNNTIKIKYEHQLVA